MRVGGSGGGDVTERSRRRAVSSDHESHQDTGEAEDRHGPRGRGEARGLRVTRRRSTGGLVADHGAVDGGGQGGSHRRTDVPGHVGDSGRTADLSFRYRRGCRRRRRAVRQAHPDGDGNERQQEGGVSPGGVDQADDDEAERGESEAEADRLPTAESRRQARHERGDGDEPDGSRQGREARFERAEP